MQSSAQRAIAIDVGGHGAKGLIITENVREYGTPIVRRYPSVVRRPGIDKRDVPGQERRDAVVELIRDLRSQAPDAHYIGVATTGTVDVTTGTITRDQSPTYQGTNWPSYLREAGVAGEGDRIAVQNDAKAGAWAEYRLWASHPEAHRRPNPNMFVRVTVGSGVGSAIVHNHKLLLGAGSVAGEFTYMPFVPPQDLKDCIPEVECNDRRSGCTESYAASPGILRGAQRAMATRRSAWSRSLANADNVSLLDVAAGYRSGDSGLVGVVKTAAYALGSALLNIIYLIGPDVVVVGGGVVEQLHGVDDDLPGYFELACEYVTRYGIIAPAINAALIAKPQFSSDDAAAIGIAYLAFDEGRPARDYR